MSVPPRAELVARFADGTAVYVELLDIELSGGRIPSQKFYTSLNEVYTDLSLPKDLANQNLLFTIDTLEKVATYSGLIALLLKSNLRRDYTQIEIRRVTPGKY